MVEIDEGEYLELLVAKYHADCRGQMAEEIARRHDALWAVLKLALDAMMEADKHFSETDEKCLALAHAIPKVIDALGPLTPHGPDIEKLLDTDSMGAQRLNSPTCA